MKKIFLFLLFIGIITNFCYSAEFLIMAKNHWKDYWNQETINGLSDKELTEYNARSQKGDIIVVRPDGWQWGRLETLPSYIIVKVPNLSYEDVKDYQIPLMEGEILRKRRRYNIPASFVDNAISAGGVLTVTSQFITAINDKQ